MMWCRLPGASSLGLLSVVNLTLLYINSEAVIPAPYQVRGKLRRESSPKTLDSGSSPE
jgi:hypothetical protein